MTIKNALRVAVWLMMASVVSAAPAPDSKRLALAKDYIADEQWVRAIAELQVVASDAKEPNRDEALFWLAHSEHATGEHAAALQTIARLERQFPASRWTRPARSLRVEIAQRLRRDDVLLVLGAPPPPPHPVPRPGVMTARMRPGAAPPPPPLPPSAVPPTMPALPGIAPPAPPAGPRTPRSPVMVMPAPALPPGFLMPTEPYVLDTDLRIQALGSLIDSHGERVIPLLRDIALDSENPHEARRALFVLAQSPRPEARRTVVDAAQQGPELVRIAAVREMGRFRGPNISTELMRVYSTAVTPRVKRQVVSSLGERADYTSLLRIARAETDTAVRNTAIVTLGQTGGRDQLRTLYVQLPHESRFAVLSALFNAKDDDELIRIARTENDTRLRSRARQHLRMLGTPKAIKFLDDNR